MYLPEKLPIENFPVTIAFLMRSTAITNRCSGYRTPVKTDNTIPCARFWYCFKLVPSGKTAFNNANTELPLLKPAIFNRFTCSNEFINKLFKKDMAEDFIGDTTGNYQKVLLYLIGEI